MKRLSLSILGTTAVLLALYATLLRLTGLQADFAETNFEANLSQIYNYLQGEHQTAVLVGSSLSARILPQYFAEAGLGVGNLGLDGSKVATGIALLRMRSDLPGLVMLEANSLLAPQTLNDREILNSMRGPSFWLGKRLFFLRPQARPSALLYSWFKRRRDVRLSGEGAAFAVDLTQRTSLTTGATNAVPIDAAHSEFEKGLKEQIRFLQGHGVRVAIVRLPAGKDDLTAPPFATTPAGIFAAAMGIPSIDLRDEFARRHEKVYYTDTLHMTGPSARSAATILAEWLRQNHLVPAQAKAARIQPK